MSPADPAALAGRTAALGRAVAEAFPWVAPGDVLAYGGTSTVLEGRDRTGDREVAIKVVEHDKGMGAVTWAGARAEAHVLTTVRAPGLVEGLEFAETATRSMLVTGRLRGHTLAQLLSRGPLPAPVACRIAVRVALALDELHRHGHLHGDIRPDNVFHADDGQPWLVDLALTRRWPHPVREQVAGTPSYLAPEAIVPGGHLTPATDVFALATLTYELIAGHLPYLLAPSDEGVMRQQVSVPPFPLRLVVPRVPPALDAVVMAGMAKQVADRIATAREFADRLDAVRWPAP